MDTTVLIKQLIKRIETLERTLIPIGAIMPFANETPPDSWAVCDGSKLSIEANSELYEAIGCNFGGSESEGYFCLPDLRGNFVRGWDKEGNIDPEREFGTMQEDALQGHNHKISTKDMIVSCSENGRHMHYIGYNNYLVWEASTFKTTYHHDLVKDYGESGNSGNKRTDYDGNHKHDIVIKHGEQFVQEPKTSKWGEIRTDTETRPRNIALLYCIKTF